MKILLIAILMAMTARGQAVYLHYYELSGDGLAWTSRELSCDADDSSAEIAIQVFEEFFSDPDIGFKPEGVSVQAAAVIKGELLLSVSGSIKNYGGTYYETGMRNQIIKTALGIPGVDRVSLYIDRKLQYLTEGSIIEEETTWPELTEELTVRPEESR